MEQIIYDAFISYSHSEPDSYIARTLHTMLEHYHISGKLQKISGKKKINRVFRDREELPLSSDLAANIRQALRQSEYLIVICSPRAVSSEWVQKEIEVFLETHEKDKILTLLVDGEPEESFPEILCYTEEKIVEADGKEKIVRTKVEPMAADVRGVTRKQMRKKLKKEFLRILAPMLSCTYDTLRQRHREYMFRRMIMLSGTIAVLAALFTVYAFRQASISEGRYQEARRNQARYLSEKSGELLAEGDREGALQTALAIQPDDESSDSPVVPEQMYALNNALYSYDRSNEIKYRPAYSVELDGHNGYNYNTNNNRLSPEETGYFCVDALGNAYILNPLNGECIWKIFAGEIEGLEEEAFRDFLPISEKTAVLISPHSIVYVNWQAKEVIRIIQEEEYFVNINTNMITVHGTLIALTNGSKVWVYNLETGECLQKVQYNEEDYPGYNTNSLSFSEDESMLAIGVSVDTNEIELQKGLLLLSLKDGSLKMFSEKETDSVMFLGNDRIAAIHYKYADKEEASETAPKRSFHLALYDVADGETIWTSAFYDTQAMNNPCSLLVENMKVDDEQKEVLATVIKDKLYLIDSNQGTIIQERSYPENISGVFKYDETRYLVGLIDGSIRLCTTEQMSTEYNLGNISADIYGFVFSLKNNTVIWPVSSSSRIVIGKLFQDEEMISLSGKTRIGNVKYYTISNTKNQENITYRCVLSDENSSLFSSKLEIYEAGSTRKLFEYNCEVEDQTIYDVYMQNIHNKTYVMIVTSGGTNQLIMADIETGKSISAVQTEEESGWSYMNYSFFHTVEKVLVHNGLGFVLADITENGLEMPDLITESISVDISAAWVSANDRYILLLSNSNAEQGIKIWDVENESWIKIEGKQIFLSGYEINIGNERNIAAVYSENGSIEIIDLEAGEVIQSFPCGYFERLEIGFMHHDKYLISCGDDSCLTLWDIETGAILMQDKNNDIHVSDIVTDGNGKYFATGFYGYMMNDNGMETSSLRIYYVDDSGRFYPYADIPDGYVSFEADEIFTGDSGGCFAPLYTYNVLRARAEDILGEKTLTETEKRQYFISE
ncbi:hypothetical protein BN3660_02040 [Eubacteriaceae bacterium CHKCI004]|nr:hypothetical protein BN3660_02040 [Eubacteriaceae bacterium CHKCI004]